MGPKRRGGGNGKLIKEQGEKNETKDDPIIYKRSGTCFQECYSVLVGTFFLASFSKGRYNKFRYIYFFHFYSFPSILFLLVVY